MGLLRFESKLQGALTVESGGFVDEIERLTGLAFGEDSGLYVAPDESQRSTFASMAAHLYQGNYNQADTSAAALDYEIVQFTDNGSGRVYYGARELLNGGVQQKGWGTFFVSANPERGALVESPHPLHDTRSWQIAAVAFEESKAKAFLLAGAHRDANGNDTADVAHLDHSIFQTVHETWTDLDTDYVSYSIHGFDGSSDTHAAFPEGADAVLSNGTGGISAEVVDLDARIDAAGFDSYAYNTLDLNDPLNQTVNGNVLGTDFSTLGATQTEQRIYSTSVGATFVHVELEQSLRLNGDPLRVQTGQIIAASITASTVAVPEPSAYCAVFACAAFYFVRRIKSAKALSLQIRNRAS